MEKKDFYSINEVAKKLGISRMTVYRLRDSGKLKFHKIGRVYRCSHADLEEYISKIGWQPKQKQGQTA